MFKCNSIFHVILFTQVDLLLYECLIFALIRYNPTQITSPGLCDRAETAFLSQGEERWSLKPGQEMERVKSGSHEADMGK